MWRIYICSRCPTGKLSFNSELKSEYLTWDKQQSFQAMTINTDLRDVSLDISYLVKFAIWW